VLIASISARERTFPGRLQRGSPFGRGDIQDIISPHVAKAAWDDPSEQFEGEDSSQRDHLAVARIRDDDRVTSCEMEQRMESNHPVRRRGSDCRPGELKL